MDLAIENEVTTKNKANDEIKLFINELSKTLEENRNIDFETTFENEIYNDIPLASKYKDQLKDIINQSFEKMSYDKAFFYFDYDKIENKYYLDYYNEGDITRTEFTKKEYKELGMKIGTFWRPYGKNGLREADYMGEGIKIDIESELDIMDFNNKNSRKVQK